MKGFQTLKSLSVGLCVCVCVWQIPSVVCRRWRGYSLDWKKREQMFPLRRSWIFWKRSCRVLYFTRSSPCRNQCNIWRSM